MSRLVVLLCAGPLLADATADWIGWLRGAVSIPTVTEVGSLSASFAARAKPNMTKSWDELRQLLQGWEFTQNYAVAVGDAEHGRLFVYEGGSFKMSTEIPTGSTSKWPSAMMFAGLVNDGTINSLDDPVSRYLTWWTKNPSDLRSTVTFRMLLSFTSGFGGGHPGEEANTRAARHWRLAHKVPRVRSGRVDERLRQELGAAAASNCNQTTGDVTGCARSIYEGVKLIGTPGQVYSYNSNHLQIAAAVAVAASGRSIKEVIKKYLLVPFGMARSFYPGTCPDFGADLITTGTDYERFLSGLLSYRTLSKAIVDASEEDSTPFMKDSYSLYGDYGFGHFLMCFDSVDGFTDNCREDKSHIDPGAFGFIPIISRKHGYYMEVVSAEIPPTGKYTLSGIPEYLAVAIKPHVDAIMSGMAGQYEEQLHHTPGLLTLGVADVNYCLDCVLHPEHCD